MSATLSAAAVGAVIAHPEPWLGGPWAAGLGWVTIVVPIVVLGLVIAAIAFVASRRRRFGWPGPGGPGHGPYGPGGPFGTPAASAERTLAERYARGDIDEQEYRARLEVLRAVRDDR